MEKNKLNLKNISASYSADIISQQLLALQKEIKTITSEDNKDKITYPSRFEKLGRGTEALLENLKEASSSGKNLAHIEKEVQILREKLSILKMSEEAARKWRLEA